MPYFKRPNVEFTRERLAPNQRCLLSRFQKGSKHKTQMDLFLKGTRFYYDSKRNKPFIFKKGKKGRGKDVLFKTASYNTIGDFYQGELGVFSKGAI